MENIGGFLNARHTLCLQQYAGMHKTSITRCGMQKRGMQILHRNRNLRCRQKGKDEFRVVGVEGCLKRLRRLLILQG